MRLSPTCRLTPAELSVHFFEGWLISGIRDVNDKHIVWDLAPDILIC